MRGIGLLVDNEVLPFCGHDSWVKVHYLVLRWHRLPVGRMDVLLNLRRVKARLGKWLIMRD